MADKERIIEVLKHTGLNASSLAKRLGYGRAQVIYNITNGGTQISRKLAYKICNEFPDINISWLLTGEGSMLNKDKDFTFNNQLSKEDNIFYRKSSNKKKYKTYDNDSELNPTQENMIRAIINDLKEDVIRLSIENEQLRELLRSHGIDEKKTGS